MDGDVPMEETNRMQHPPGDEGLRSVTTTRVHGGHAGSTWNTSCACHGDSPLLSVRRSSSALPSGIRNFKQDKKSSQYAASPSAVSCTATPPSAATPPATWADGMASMKLPSMKLPLSGLRIFKRSRSALSQSDSSPSISSTAIVPSQQEALAAPATTTSTRTEPVSELSDAMALMKSPTKAAKSLPNQSAGERRVVLHETEGPTHVVPYNPGGAYRTFGNGTRLTPAEVLQIKHEQRNSQGMYSSAFFFPTLKDRTEGGNLTDEDRVGRTALRRTLRYLCDGTGGCRVGDCLRLLQESDVLQFRQQFMRRKLDACGKCIPQKDLLVSDLAPAWNRSTESWGPLSVAVDDVTTVKLCCASYGLLCGAAASTLRRAMEAVKTAPVTGGHLVPIQAAKSAQNVREQRSEDYCLVRQYVASLIDQHEANPAPGAHQPASVCLSVSG